MKWEITQGESLKNWDQWDFSEGPLDISILLQVERDGILCESLVVLLYEILYSCLAPQKKSIIWISWWISDVPVNALSAFLCFFAGAGYEIYFWEYVLMLSVSVPWLPLLQRKEKWTFNFIQSLFSSLHKHWLLEWFFFFLKRLLWRIWHNIRGNVSWSWMTKVITCTKRLCMHLTMKNAKSLHTFVVKPNNSRPGLCFYVWGRDLI